MTLVGLFPIPNRRYIMIGYKRLCKNSVMMTPSHAFPGQFLVFYQPRTLNKLLRGSPMVSTCSCCRLWASTSGVFCWAKILLYVFLLLLSCEATYVATQLTAPMTTTVGSILEKESQKVVPREESCKDVLLTLLPGRSQLWPCSGL